MSKNEQDVVIVGAARTPTGKLMGGLGTLTAPQLGAEAIKAAVSRAGVDPNSIYEVIMGNVVQAGVLGCPQKLAALPSIKYAAQG